MAGILEGVRVADFGRYIAGPYAASILGDLGAEVIRVENVGGGIDRHVVPLSGDEGGATYQAINRNKKSLTVDQTSSEGKAIVRRLIETSQIVMVNLPPQTLVGMGLDYESLKAIKPDVILVTMNAFGSGGPWSHRTGFDGVAQAMSGIVHMSGHPGDPMKAYGPWVDFATGTYAALGALAALLWHRQTGEGQHVESAMLSAAIQPAATLLVEQGVLNVNRQPTGNRSQTGAPADLFRTKDGRVLMQIVGDALFRRWCRMVGANEWISDPRFANDPSRVDHADILSERMSAWCAGRTTQEVLDALEAASLPGGPVLTPQEVLDHEHLKAIGAFQPMGYPGMVGQAPLLTLPVRLSATPGTIRSHAPTIGADNAEILTNLGYDEATQAAWREAGRI